MIMRVSMLILMMLIKFPMIIVPAFVDIVPGVDDDAMNF